MMTLQPFFDRYLPALEAEMQEVVATSDPELRQLYGYLHYHLGWADEQFRPTGGQAGKRLRPVFCLLSCEASGGAWEQALPASAAVELLHNFSLIHDDIEDNDRTRRGRPTLWALWGVPQALNAGDALYALAHIALLRLGERGVPQRIVVAAMDLFTRACLRLTEGQFLDISFEAREEVPPEEYLRMVEGKTAALLATACELGGLVAGTGPSCRDRLHHFGHHIGLAFQIQDDLLGIWGDPAVTGKPVGSDLIHRKKTLPILYGLRQSEPLRELLAREKLSPEDVTRAVELLEVTGSRAWAQEQAREQTELALTALEAADLHGPAADGLRDLALSLVGRER